MLVPKSIKCACEVTEELCQREGFGLITIVKRELSHQVAQRIIDLNSGNLTGINNPLSMTTTFTIDGYYLTRVELETMLYNAVNRSKTGMPPVYF